VLPYAYLSYKAALFLYMCFIFAFFGLFGKLLIVGYLNKSPMVEFL
jgi:hypothetical protein